MNQPNFLSHARTVSLAFLALSALASSLAYGQLRDFDGMMGRDYHARLHDRGRCTACHEDSGEAVAGYPKDGICLDCHRMEKLVSATMPEAEEDKLQNPHDSLHYGREVPCIECHGEHTRKEPLCADCHNFDFPDHQE